MKYLYRLYQLFIALPLIAVYTVLTCIVVIIGCAIGNGHFWDIIPASCGHSSSSVCFCCP